VRDAGREVGREGKRPASRSCGSNRPAPARRSARRRCSAGDLALVDIDAKHVVADLRQACARDQANISATEEMGPRADPRLVGPEAGVTGELPVRRPGDDSPSRCRRRAGAQPCERVLPGSLKLGRSFDPAIDGALGPGKLAGSLPGGVPERSKGSDCKSDGSAFGGSNPPPSTKSTRTRH
jgi:hypothetical protein